MRKRVYIEASIPSFYYEHRIWWHGVNGRGSGGTIADTTMIWSQALP